MSDPAMLAGLTVSETSGVDHPAHMREGWVVMKSATPEEIAEVEALLVKERDMPDETTDATPVDDQKVAALEEQVATLTKALDEAKAQIPAPAPEPEPTPEDLIKSAPEPVRKALEEATAVAKAAVARAEALEAEKKEAIEKAADAAAASEAEVYKALGADPGALGPALRRFAMIDPTGEAEVRKALNAAVVQTETSEIFKSIGHNGAAPAADTAYARLTVIAKNAVDSGLAPTMAQAMADAAVSNPDLYKTYLAEKG